MTRYLIHGTLWALVLFTCVLMTGCAAVQRQMALDAHVAAVAQREQQARYDAALEVYRNATPEEQAWIRNEIARRDTLRQQCNQQAAMASATARGGIFRQAMAGFEMSVYCQKNF